MRRHINVKFAARSRIAWTMYDKDFSNKQYMPKYYQREDQELDLKGDPLLHFKLDRKKLNDIILSP